MWLIKIALRLCFLLALAYVGLCVLLYAMQRRMLYHPTDCALCTPQNTMTFTADDGIILTVSTQATYLPKAILYFGGNAEDVSLSMPDFAALFPNHAIYAMHYRGYGKSGGSPSEAALLEDAERLFELIKGKHTEISVIGRSLGTGIATHLAAIKPVFSLALITPYDSIQGVASERFPYIPVAWLLKDTYDSGKNAALITAPTLVLMAEHDEIISRTSTEQLFSRFSPGIASMVLIPDAGHNDISDKPAYETALKQAVERGR